MKEIKELKFEEMTLEQKVGFAMVGGSWRPILNDKEDLEYVLELIKKRSLGALWVSCHAGENRDFAEVVRIIKEAADYPILIMTDEESGFGNYMMGNPIALGYIGSEDAAYAYGKAIAIESRKAGYNFVCNPLLDRVRGNCPCGGVLRSLHPDKEMSAKLAAAMCEGMHDGGILNCAKHYPSPRGLPIDSHMAEGYSEQTKEELLEDNLYAYKYLIDRGLVDAVMVGHRKMANIDNKYPASLSEKVMDILRKDLSFDGIVVTDALEMMGVVAKFGEVDPKWMCIDAGCDLALGFTVKTKATYDAILNAVKSGKLPMDKLDEAVKRVLKYQHKAYELETNPKFDKLTEEEEKLAKDINKHSIATICDKGVDCAIPTEGKHFFVLLTQNEVDLNKLIENDTMSVSWYKPERIVRKIKENFPNSGYASLTEFPSVPQLSEICRKRLGYDDVVFITFFENAPYVGKEAFTPRITSLMEAWQISENCISAAIHFGNPFLIEEMPHIPRIINACKSTACTEYAIDVLAGKLEAKGKIPYDIKLK